MQQPPHENACDDQTAGVQAAIVEQIRMLETLLAFPEDVCTDFAADALVIRTIGKDIDTQTAALHEVQHRKKRHRAIAWEQKRLAIDSWAKEAVQGSMTAAHKHLNRSETPPPLPSDVPAAATSDLTCTAHRQRGQNQDEASVGSMKDIRTATVDE